MQSVSPSSSFAASSLANTAHWHSAHLHVQDAFVAFPSHPARKSPPPPKINLDDCKPNFTTPSAVANTSSNPAPSPSPSAAFVFTSSRTVRSSAPISQSPPSVSSVFSSRSASPHSAPDSPDTLSVRAAFGGHKPRPSLSPSQLAKHSKGALDARCVVGPNMRAAGFVPLAHSMTPTSRRAATDGLPSSQNSGGVPTPSEPPPFPPIMFVHTPAPMWDFQREMGWADVSRCVAGAAGQRLIVEQDLIASTSYSSPSLAPSASATSYLTSVSSSSSDVLSVPSLVPTALADLPSVEYLAESDRDSAHDGFPFPRTPPRKPLLSARSPPKSPFSTDSFVTASEGSIIHASPVVCAANLEGTRPAAGSPPRTSCRSSHLRSNTAPTVIPADTSSETKLRAHHSTDDLSLTQLIDNSTSAWVTCSNYFGYTPSSLSDSASGSHRSEENRGRSRTCAGDGLGGTKEKGGCLKGEKENTQSFLPAPTLNMGRPMSVIREASDSGIADDGEVLLAARTFRDKEQERYTMESPKPVVDLLDPTTRVSIRPHGYSSFTFPPHSQVHPKTIPHQLGDHCADCNSSYVQQQYREYRFHRGKPHKGIGALVQMHRDRDREQARQSEREHRTDRRFDPEADKVKAGNDDEIDVVLELEKDWEKSQKLYARRSHKERRKLVGHIADGPRSKTLEPLLLDAISSSQLTSLGPAS